MHTEPDKRPTTRARISAALVATRRLLPAETNGMLALLVVLLLFVRMLWIVLQNVVDAPFMDEWLIWSDLLRARDNERLSWSFIVSPYNGHRLAVVRLMLLALLPTQWIVYPQVLLTAVVSASFMAILWRQYRRTAREIGVAANPWAAVALAVMVFSCADINRLWGMGIEWHVVVLASSSCLMLLASPPLTWGRFVFAALCAITASFSTASGLLAWVLGLPVLFLAAAQSPVRMRAVAAWTATAFTACLLYLRGIPNLPVPELTLRRVVDSAHFLLLYIGQPLSLQYDFRLFLWIGIAGGLLSVVMLTVLWRRRLMPPTLPWIALASFSIASGVMIVAAREPSQIAAYYVTSARPFWVAAVAVLCLMLAPAVSDRRVPISGWRHPLLILVLALLLGEWFTTRATMQLWVPVREAIAQTAYDAPDVCAGNWEAANRVTYPADSIRTRYPILAEHATSFTRGVGLQDLELLSEGDHGAIEQATVESGPPDINLPCVRISGWAGDLQRGEPAQEVWLTDGGRVLKRSLVNRPTPEVSTRSGQAGLARSGWSIFVSQDRWPRDVTGLAVYSVAQGKRRGYRLETTGGVAFPAGDLAPYIYPLGSVVDLTLSHPETVYRLGGFGGPEAAGRWTDSGEATIDLTLRDVPTRGLKLVARMHAFVSPKVPVQRVELLVNGRPAGTWQFNLQEPAGERELLIRALNTRHIRITLRLPNATSPASLDLGPDPRKLAVSVSRFLITAR